MSVNLRVERGEGPEGYAMSGFDCFCLVTEATALTSGLQSEGMLRASLNANVHITGGSTPASRPMSQRMGFLPLRRTLVQWTMSLRP